MSRKNNILGLPELEKSWLSWYFHTYEHLKFHAQLRWAWKKFYWAISVYPVLICRLTSVSQDIFLVAHIRNSISRNCKLFLTLRRWTSTNEFFFKKNMNFADWRTNMSNRWRFLSWFRKAQLVSFIPWLHILTEFQNLFHRKVTLSSQKRAVFCSVRRYQVYSCQGRIGIEEWYLCETIRGRRVTTERVKVVLLLCTSCDDSLEALLSVRPSVCPTL